MTAGAPFTASPPPPPGAPTGAHLNGREGPKAKNFSPGIDLLGAGRKKSRGPPAKGGPDKGPQSMIARSPGTPGSRHNDRRGSRNKGERRDSNPDATPIEKTQVTHRWASFHPPRKTPPGTSPPGGEPTAPKWGEPPFVKFPHGQNFPAGEILEKRKTPPRIPLSPHWFKGSDENV